MRSERLRERKPLTHKTGIKWVKCCGAVAFLKTCDRAKYKSTFGGDTSSSIETGG